MASDHLLVLTHKIIICCDALLSEADGPLNEMQREWIESIDEVAGERIAHDGSSSGLLSVFSRYAAQSQIGGEQSER